MPMPISLATKFISPHSTLNEKRVLPPSGSVGEHVQRFLLSQETAATDQPLAIEIPPYVREYTGSATSNHGVESARVKDPKKPRSISNQTTKQVRFDIKSGLMDLIRETGLDVNNIRNKSESVTRSAIQSSRILPLKKISNSNGRILPETSEKEAIRLALNYKREIIQKQKRNQSSDEEDQQPDAQKKIIPQPIPQPKILVQEQQSTDLKYAKAGTIKRIARFKTEDNISIDMTTISHDEATNSEENMNIPPVLQDFQNKTNAGSILRQTRSASRPVEHLSPIYSVNAAASSVYINKPPLFHKADSPIRLSPQNYKVQSPLQAQRLVQKKFSLITLVQIKNQNDLEEQINDLIKHHIPKAKQLLHQLLKPNINGALEYKTKQRNLQLIRQNLRTIVLEQFLGEIDQLNLLKQRLETHKEFIQSSQNIAVQQQEQLKLQIVQDIISRIQQKLFLSYLKINVKYRQELRSKFLSYHSLVVNQPIIQKVMQNWREMTKNQKQKRICMDQYIQTLDYLRLRQLLVVWKEVTLIKKVKNLRNQEILQNVRSKVMRKIFQGWHIAKYERKILALGVMLADRLRVYRLRWCIFAGWCAKHRNGTKIKRLAIARLQKPLNSNHNFVDLSKTSLILSNSNDGTYSLQDSRVWFQEVSERAKFLLIQECSDIINQRNLLKLKLKNLNEQQDQQYRHSEIQQKLFQNISSKDLNFTNLQEQKSKDFIVNESDITQFLQPQMYLKMVNSGINSMPKFYEQKEKYLDTKYNIHAALVQHQNQMLLNQNHVDKEISQIQQSEDLYINTIEQQQNDSLPQPLLNFGHKREVKIPNQLYKKLRDQCQSNVNIETVKIQIKNQIQLLISMIRQAEYNDTPSFHRSQALYMQFKTHLSSDQNGVSLEEFVNVAQQSGASFVQLNNFRKLSEQLLRWKIQYLKKVINQDLQSLHGLVVQEQVLAAWYVQIQKEEKLAEQHYKTRTIQNFYQLFTNWAKKTRVIVYNNIRNVRLFRVKFVLNKWRQYLGRNDVYRSLENAAFKFRSHQLLTKSLVSLYQNKLKESRILKFQKRWAYLKFFKRRWQPGTKNIQLMKRVFQNAQSRHQNLERNRYQMQFDLMKRRFDVWRVRVNERNQMIKKYMALNHYKITLQVRAFRSLKKLPRQNFACNLMRTIVIKQLKSAFSKIKNCQQYQESLYQDYNAYRERVLKSKVVKQWHQQVIQNKIAKMFFKRKYLKALQDFILVKQYQKPQRHYNQRLKVIVFYTLRDCKLQRWQRERDQIFKRAIKGKYSTSLKRKCFQSLINCLIKAKRKRIIDQTVVEFRQHTLLEKTMRHWTLFNMLKRRKKLQNQVADEFRVDQLQRKIYKGSLEMVISKQSGDLVNRNKDLQQRVMLALKKNSGINLEGRLQQVIKAKAQIRLVRCFLTWRSLAKFHQSDNTVSQMNSYSPSPNQHTKNGFIFSNNNKLSGSKSSLIFTSDDKASKLSSGGFIVSNKSRSNSSLDLQYKMLITQGELNNLVMVSKDLNDDIHLISSKNSTDQKPQNYNNDMFLQTSQSVENNNSVLKTQFMATNTLSVNSNIFGELDQLQKQQQQWSQDYEERERILKEMQLQYQSLKSSI